MSIKGGQMPADDAMKPFYVLGVNIALQVGSELKTMLSKEELDLCIKGFTDSMTGAAGDEKGKKILVPSIHPSIYPFMLFTSTFNPRKYLELLRTYGPGLNEVLQSRAGAALAGIKSEGDEFISSYLLKNPDAVKTASGMVFHNTGLATDGPKPELTSKVTVHYHGTLTDGTVFDSSKDRGEPITFPLNGVIKGWQEGVGMMSKGGKATLVIPSDLGYGDGGSPPVIPPGATLVFDVELIEVA